MKASSWRSALDENQGWGVNWREKLTHDFFGLGDCASMGREHLGWGLMITTNYPCQHAAVAQTMAGDSRRMLAGETLASSSSRREARGSTILAGVSTSSDTYMQVPPATFLDIINGLNFAIGNENIFISGNPWPFPMVRALVHEF